MKMLTPGKKKTNYSFPISMEEDGFSILLALLIK